MSRARRWLVVGALCLSCKESETTTKRTGDERAALGGAIAARVGGEPVPLSVVAKVAESQSVSPAEATRHVVDDEIAAAAARQRGLERDPAVLFRLRSARARLTSERLYAEARERGLPTDAEVKAVSERHWIEVDRPPAVRVIHALVARPKNPERLAAARALATEMHRVLAEAPTEQFMSTANALPREPKLQVIAERLPAFTEEGLVTEGGGGMDPVFSKAAFALRSPGDTSAIVETPFGFHVIRLVERVPERRMSFETRRLAFAEEVYVIRAHDLLTSILERQKRANEVVVASTAERLMSTVKVTQESSREP